MSEGRLLALGDVHGAERALEQVWVRADVTTNDRVVFVGDVADGWPETKEAISFFLEWQEDGGELIALLGNHDKWMRDWFSHPAKQPQLWLRQGGRATVQSYGQWNSIPVEHKEYARDLKLYHEEAGRLFVHADFVPGRPPDAQFQRTLIWDRDLANYMVMGKDDQLVPEYEEVFIGHTSTTYLADQTAPLISRGVVNLDTGAGYSGRLTLMDVHTHEYWQSDPVTDLYPDHEGR